MKAKHPLKAKSAALLLAAIGFATGSVGAQTSVYYTSGSGAPAPGGAINGGTLATIGLDSYQYSSELDAHSDPGTSGVTFDGFGYFFTNYTFGSLPSSHDGGALESVTFFLWAQSISPGTGTSTFQIYNGLDGTGGNAGTWSVDSTSVPRFLELTVSAAVLSGGFSVGGIAEGNLLVLATESNTDPFVTPMIVANYAVPEPSAAILGAVGTLGLLRRRRR